MTTKSQRQERREVTLSSLNTAIEALNLTKETTNTTPALAVFDTVSALLITIRDSVANDADHIELGLACVDVCQAFDRGMGGRQLDEVSRSVGEAIEQLMTTVEVIQGNITGKGGRNLCSRLLHTKDDKEVMTAWRRELNRILHVFDTELITNTHALVAKIHRNASTGQEGTGSQQYPTQVEPATPNDMGLITLHSRSTPLGELPPPPRACFGRDELIEKIVGLAEGLTSIALIGAGGIGKTSIALTVLHHDRIKQRFGDNRRFIRCDQFPASRTHFLARLSKVVGAKVENPEDLTPLRSHLSSTDMILFLDNTESILDPQGVNAREMYDLVEELSRFSNICLGITSRISTIPPDYKIFRIPTLSAEAARNAFYRIYRNGEQPGLVDKILKQLNFHPLSVTLLATVTHHSKWDNGRLAREWEVHRTRVLQEAHNKSLAATIEFSLASPLFHQLGPDARDLLGVIAFFPQGVDENLDWLFPTRTTFKWLSPASSDRKNIIDKFCTLALTYRSNGFVTMLAPLRDYFCPKDPRSSPLLCRIKKHYFRRLSIAIDPNNPNFEETRWIASEDVNVEHLLNVFATIDPNSREVWATCAHFIEHLCWHKKRLVTLGPKIEGLPDDHPSKPECLFELSRLSDSVGNHVESKRLLLHTLGLWRERGNDFEVASTLRFLSVANQMLGLYEEGIQQAREALGIYKWLYHTQGQALSLQRLSRLLYDDNQLDAAEEAASRAINLLSGKREQYVVCVCHRILGLIWCSRGETEKAVDHFETALRIASRFNWHDQLSRNNYDLAELFFKEGRFGDAHASVERAKSYAVNDPYYLACAMRLQARFWYGQSKFEEAESEVLRAADVFERLGVAKDLEECMALLRDIEEK